MWFIYLWEYTVTIAAMNCNFGMRTVDVNDISVLVVYFFLMDLFFEKMKMSATKYVV
jgi:hypothetical protein